MIDIVVHAAAIAFVCMCYGIIGAGFVFAVDRYDPSSETGWLTRLLVACFWPVAMFTALAFVWRDRAKRLEESDGVD